MVDFKYLGQVAIGTRKTMCHFLRYCFSRFGVYINSWKIVNLAIILLILFFWQNLMIIMLDRVCSLKVFASKNFVQNSITRMDSFQYQNHPTFAFWQTDVHLHFIYHLYIQFFSLHHHCLHVNGVSIPERTLEIQINSLKIYHQP
jgi:hypothetical protein